VAKSSPDKDGGGVADGGINAGINASGGSVNAGGPANPVAYRGAVNGGDGIDGASVNAIDAKKMPLVDHIEELRWTLIRCGCAVILCAVPCGVYWRRIFDFAALWPLRLSDPAPKIIYTAPAEAVMLSVKIALACGAVAASPFIFWQVWRFVSPGLYKNERAVILPAVAASTLCFLAGIAFCYCVLPTVLKFLTGFSQGQIDPYFRIDEYISFLMKMCLAFGAAFELPVAAFVLSKMGVIDHKFLIRYFRYAVVAIFIAAALLTPPDVLSQIFLAMPLLVLYALSILIAFLARRGRGGGA
jgi:sec-independent protein translocase protein TatC